MGLEPTTSALRKGLPAKRKLLPFRKLQPPKKNHAFYIPSHSLPSHIRHVQLFLATYWPHGIGACIESISFRVVSLFLLCCDGASMLDSEDGRYIIDVIAP